MTQEPIDHATLFMLVGTKSVRRARIVGQPGGWGIVIKQGTTEHVLTTQRSQEIRLFRKFETLVGYLKSVGIVHFDVDAANWNADTLTTRQRPDTSVAMKQAHEAAAYDKWLRAEVQEAINDTSPTIPHDEVMRSVRAAIKAVRSKRVPA
ncbi:type II toxin-antitoxin system RelB family antitoxin [Massilia aquatica]|uniref:Stability determinant domain-containing protein n=1 Tax=Massilia aquatica TaxID=2609000 RepID=A0ABX0MFY9_9BURK|nr:hypothetical protein [Massilia aquatica]NHZ42811.1 hypothetical protein [Massilia aquatica]